MKKILTILVSLIVLVALALSVLYCIDMNRMRNNEAILFSNWGYDYAPPEKDTPLSAFERIEKGTKRSEIIKSFGEPAGELSGLWGDIYLVENKKIVILYVGNDLDDAVVEGIKIVDIEPEGEKAEYDEVKYEKYPDGSTSDKFISVRRGEFWGIIDKDGNEILSSEKYNLEKISLNTYEEVWPIIEVQKDGLWGAIDYYGNMIIEPKWQKIWMDVYNVPNVVYVYDGVRWGGMKLSYDKYIDKYNYEGMRVSEVDYDMKLSKELPIVEL